MRTVFLLFFFFWSVPVCAYERIIVLGAPAAELACALGLEDRLVGRGDWDLWPPALRSLPQVGGAGSPNLERILWLRPDFVLADRHFGELTRRLDSYGIPSLLFSAYNTQEVIPAVRLVAAALNQRERGEELAADLQILLTLVEDRLQAVPPAIRPRGLALTGRAGEYFSFSGQNGWHFLDYAGGRNICEGMAQPFPVISREWILTAKPDFVLLSPYRTEYTEEDREAALERAVREFSLNGPSAGQVIALDDLLTFGPRSIPGALYLAKALHPALFADLDAEAIHTDFLRKYFSYVPQGRHSYP